MKKLPEIVQNILSNPVDCEKLCFKKNSFTVENTKMQ